MQPRLNTCWVLLMTYTTNVVGVGWGGRMGSWLGKEGTGKNLGYYLIGKDAEYIGGGRYVLGGGDTAL